jgi:hypothetical protein
MQTYTFQIEEFNQKQILNEILSKMNLRLFNNYSNDPTSDGESYVSENGLVLMFRVDLTESQINQLNNIITNYVFNPYYDDLFKFKINQSTENPRMIDYDILGLNKKRTIIKGELRLIEYYKNYIVSANTYSDLVVVETRDYTRDEIGIATSRNLSSSWLLNNGTTGLTINSTKYYTQEEGIQEGLDRRSNMIGFAKTSLLNGLKEIHGEPANQNYAFDMLTSVKIEIDYFIQGYTQPLRDAVSASTKPYLTVGIKEAVIEQLRF